MTKALGLYIHVPFCASKCSYCDFYSFAGKKEYMDRYVDAVCEHIRQYGALSTGYRVDTVYFGGGTPSLLGAKRLTKLIGDIRKYFPMVKKPEITIECNPDSMNKPLLRALRKAGANRLSIGVQSVLEDELKQLGRIHSWEQAKEMILLAKKLKFTNIGVDLIYGQPHQTIEKLMQSVRAVLELEPTHLSCYALQVEPHTPLGRQEPVLPDDDAQADMYDTLCQRLKEAGFEHYEVSNWARGGNRSRHNCKYWDLSEYLGLGPGAHSYMNGQRFAFVKDLDAYCDGMTENGGSLVEEEDDVPTMNRHGEYLMLRLRTSDGIDENVFHNLFDRPFAPYAKKLEKFIASGLVACETGRWHLTEKGLFVSNAIIAQVLSADTENAEETAEDTMPEAALHSL